MAEVTLERHLLDDAEEVAHVLKKCIVGREVVLRFRHRRRGRVRTATVVCPVKWTRGRLLAYARRCHPDETVRIEEWKPIGKDDNPWDPRLWLVNPTEMV